MAETGQNVPEFILASGSPRRKLLLEEAGYSFRVVVSDIHEPPAEDFPSPEAHVAHTAWLKGDAVSKDADQWVLAADTMAAIDGDILGKPADRDDAARILRRLAGTRHRVLTGVYLWLPKPTLAMVAVETTWVAMRPLSDADLQAYLDTGLWEGKAGAYGIQDHDDPFVEAVDGSYTNVMGLPMEKLHAMFTAALRVDKQG